MLVQGEEERGRRRECARGETTTVSRKVGGEVEGGGEVVVKEEDTAEWASCAI